MDFVFLRVNQMGGSRGDTAFFQVVGEGFDGV